MRAVRAVRAVRGGGAVRGGIGAVSVRAVRAVRAVRGGGAVRGGIGAVSVRAVRAVRAVRVVQAGAAGRCGAVSVRAVRGGAGGAGAIPATVPDRNVKLFWGRALGLKEILKGLGESMQVRGFGSLVNCQVQKKGWATFSNCVRLEDPAHLLDKS